MAAARLETTVLCWLQCYGFCFPASHPEIYPSKEHTGERALPWTVGEPEGERKRLSSLKGCKQWKEMLEVYLEVSWTRLFLSYLSFVTVTIRVNFSQAFSLKKKKRIWGSSTITRQRELKHHVIQIFQYKVGQIETDCPIASLWQNVQLRLVWNGVESDGVIREGNSAPLRCICSN